MLPSHLKPKLSEIRKLIRIRRCQEICEKNTNNRVINGVDIGNIPRVIYTELSSLYSNLVHKIMKDSYNRRENEVKA